MCHCLTPRPENLLINEQGRIVIIDMGHAKRVPSSGVPSPLALSRTTTTNPYGTPAFNAPEVTGGKSYDCELSDVWSVGVISFYLHGKLPAFQAGGGVADPLKHCSGPNNDPLWKKIQDSTQTFLKSWKALSTPYGGWIPMRGLDSASWKKPSMQTRKLSGNFPACNGLADPSMKLKASSTSFPAVVQTRRFTPLQAVPGDGSSCDTCFMGH